MRDSSFLFVGSSVDEAIRSQRLGEIESHFEIVSKDLSYGKVIDRINAVARPIEHGMFSRQHAKAMALVAYEAALYETTRDKASAWFIGSYLNVLGWAAVLRKGGWSYDRKTVREIVVPAIDTLTKDRQRAILDVQVADPLVKGMCHLPKTADQRLFQDIVSTTMQLGSGRDKNLKQTQMANFILDMNPEFMDLVSGTTSGLYSLEECHAIFLDEQPAISPVFFNHHTPYTRWGVLRNRCSTKVYA